MDPTATPTIGRIVHYMDDSENKWPAMVTLVEPENGEIALTVFMSNGTNAGITASIRPLTEDKAIPGAWWWPVVNKEAK